ncbi:hypothetical protein [Kribbella sp. NPDC004536]|uniref:hypothetical protein n=1 Tax=Kribbella sp. NPDC004536 TaxID=3364106 RepID=UPI00369C7843
MADDVEDVIEQARQKLVQIVRMMMRFMDNRSHNDSRFFRSLVERQAPGMQRMIDQGHSDAQISGTLGEFLKPGWEGNLTQAFRLMDDKLPVFRDPAVQQATDEYLALRPQLVQRAGQITTELQNLGAPGAAAEFQRLTQEATARIDAAAPRGRPPTSATRAPGGLPTPPRPTQAPTGPGAQPTPPPTRAPGPGGQPPPRPSQAPGTAQAPGAGPLPPQPQTGQVPGVAQSQAGQVPGAAPTTPQPQAAQVSGASATPGQAQGTSKRVEAREAGPVTLNTKLMNTAGTINITTGPPGSRAHITFSTTATDGPAADAVNRAEMRAEPDGQMVANAMVTGASASVTTHSSNGTYTQTVTQHGSGGIAVVGNIDELTIDGDNIHIGNISGSNATIAVGNNAVAINNGTFAIGRTAPPIRVDAVVPEGSTVIADSGAANITTDGNLRSVDAHSVSGNISTGRADSIKATSVSGNVTVHVDRPCDVRAGSVSGNVSVTASSPEVASQTRLNTAAEPGKLQTPQGANSPAPQSGQASDGARENPTRNTQTRQTGQGLGA